MNKDTDTYLTYHLPSTIMNADRYTTPATMLMTWVASVGMNRVMKNTTWVTRRENINFDMPILWMDQLA